MSGVTREISLTNYSKVISVNKYKGIFYLFLIVIGCIINSGIWLIYNIVFANSSSCKFLTCNKQIKIIL